MDLSCPLPPSPVGGGVLSKISASAWDLGVQRVIYADTVYDAGAPAGRPYTGSSRHLDHLHIEQTREFGEHLTYSRAVELLDGAYEDLGEQVMLIVAFRGAQWVVRSDLSGKVGISQSVDVNALLRVGGGRVYFPATLTDAIMERIPTLA